MDKIAFLFAGQGSQYVGMGKDLYEYYSTQDIFDGVKKINPDILNIMWNGPAEELNKTINTQAAVFSHDLAVAELLRDRGILADTVAGFSLGEIPALVFGKMLGLEDGLKLINTRSRVMQTACEKHGGAMVAAMKLNADKIENIAKQFNNVWTVNYNSPEQTVCACSLESAESFIEEITKQGGRAIRLKVSGAFHCPYMNSASTELLKLLENLELKRPLVPIYSNFTAKLYDEGDYKELISKQVNNPVLWQQTIENMMAYGVRTFIEVGPGNVLNGLVKKIAEAKGVGGIKILNAFDVESIRKVAEDLK